MQKRLYKINYGKMVSGVCGGIAEYLNLDPTLVRIAWVILSLATAFSGVLIYIIAALIMPSKDQIM